MASTTSKGIPLLSLSDPANIELVNNSLQKIDELLAEAGESEAVQEELTQIKQSIEQIKQDVNNIKGQNIEEIKRQIQEINTKIQQANNKIDTHANTKISQSGGVHGLEYLEADGSLQIEKQNGEKVKFSSGVSIDEIFREYTNDLEQIITKVGR